MIGSNIENYKIVSLLGEGGMGIVYRAFDLKLERYVALKILNSQATTNSQFKERFKREAKHQAKLNHSNIVPVYGFTEQNGILGIVMEYVEGETLEKLIERKGRLQLLDSLYIIKQLLSGISYAHKKGFIHRDIKPSNIIVSTENNIKIMDFGISKSLNELHGITKTGTKMGTILYMSPEQIKAQEPTAQSDLYSIGITFFEMLAGKTPFDIGNEFQIMEAHLKKNPPKLSNTYNYIPDDSDKIIQKSLAKQLNKRYLTCEEMLTDVNALILSIEHQNKSKNSRSEQKKPKTEKIRFYIFALFFIAIVTALFVVFFGKAKEYWSKSFNDNKQETFIKEAKAEPLIKFSQLPIKNNSSLSSVTFVNDYLAVTCGSDGSILRSVDQGKTWTSLSDSTFGNLHKVYFLSIDKGFIVGDNGVILTSADSGNTWKKIESTYNNSFFNISFADENTGFIVGTKGCILKTTNAGNDWKDIPSSTTANLFGLYVNGKNRNIFIVGWDGQLLKSTDLGDSWNINTLIAQKYLRSINFYDENTGFTVGGGGVILRTNDGGKNWERINTNVYSGLMNVKFKDSKEGMILGSKGEILLTRDGGDTWTNIPTGIFYSLTDIVFNHNKIFITGYNGTLLKN